MGHFEPTPQSGCRARRVITRALRVTQFVLLRCSTLSNSPHVSSQIFLYDCTEVSPFSLLFFGGDITIQKDEGQETVAVDQWIVFRSPARIAHLVKVGERCTTVSYS